MFDSTEKNKNHSRFNIDDHIIRLHYLDGFGWRGMAIELLINLDFVYDLCYSTFETDQKIAHGSLPKAISDRIETLLEQDLSSLELDYFVHPGASSSNSYYLTVNQ